VCPRPWKLGHTFMVLIMLQFYQTSALHQLLKHLAKVNYQEHGSSCSAFCQNSCILCNIMVSYCVHCGPGSSVSIATDYGLDGPGIKSQWGGRFFAHVQTGPGAHPASCIMGTGSFPGVKRPGRGADQPPPPSAEVENE
jgi:hypothetical protein